MLRCHKGVHNCKQCGCKESTVFHFSVAGRQCWKTKQLGFCHWSAFTAFFIWIETSNGDDSWSDACCQSEDIRKTTSIMTGLCSIRTKAYSMKMETHHQSHYISHQWRIRPRTGIIHTITIPEMQLCINHPVGRRIHNICARRPEHTCTVQATTIVR